MQATVASYEDGQGLVVLDDGTQLAFTPAALAGSGIRLLHPGQRVSIQTDEGAEAGAEECVVRRLWLPGLGEPNR